MGMSLHLQNHKGHSMIVQMDKGHGHVSVWIVLILRHHPSCQCSIIFIQHHYTNEVVGMSLNPQNH